MKRRSILTVNISICLIMSLFLLTGAKAQDPPVKMSLMLDQTTYAPNDPIRIQVRTTNVSGGEVIAQDGFLNQYFHLLVTFIDPDGVPVKSRFAMIEPEPGPPYRFEVTEGTYCDTVPVEVIPVDAEAMVIAEDGHKYYDLTKTGWYTAQVLVPLQTFSESYTDPGGNPVGCVDDAERQEYNPLASNKVRFEIVSPDPDAPTSAIHAQVNLLKIGGGTKPGATKTPLEGVPVRLIRQSTIPEDYYPVNFKTYEMIWANVSAEASRVTDANGKARFEIVSQDDYLLLALYDASQDFRHMGSPIGSADEDWLTDQPIEKQLMVMEKYNGRKAPGKTTRRKGSDLLITEPEFMLWDSDEESYPFVFETVGKWEVETSISPPSGFETDYKSLDAEVTNDIQAVQFTITDKGSRWEETKVKHKIKHKGKKEKIETKIGIKLSKKLQKKKGLGPYGHTKHPGPYKGGKKKKKKDKK